jgi:pilus assembly protein CpaB
MKTRLVGAIVALVLAVAGALVLTAYVRGADARASDGAAFVTVYVVTARIPAGTTATAAETRIAEKSIPASAAVAGRVTDLNQLDGKVADVALVPGEQILASRWLPPAEHAVHGKLQVPAGMQTVTIALPIERIVGGTVKVGDTVGIVIAATLKSAGGTDAPTTKEVFQKVLVTAVASASTQTSKASGPADIVMVTLARSTADIEKLVWGQQFGTVWLTTETAKSDESGSRQANGNEVFK